MTVKRQAKPQANTSLLDILSQRYLPFWPLFALLSILFLLLAFVATRYMTPAYRITATLVINDKVRGTEESETLQSLNLYGGSKIVENEVLVLSSRTLMREVVLEQELYAPVFEEGVVKAASAYLTSPIIVQAQEPEQVVEQPQVEFAYDEATKQVEIGSESYPLGKWVKFSFGVIRFLPNPNQVAPAEGSLYFSLLDPRRITEALQSRLEVGASSKLSSVINIAFTDEVPERGEDIVNGLLKEYTKLSILENRRLAESTLAFVTDRLSDVESDLDSINRSIQEFRTAEGVVDLSEQGRLYLQNVSDIDRKTAEFETQLAVLDQVEEYVRSGANRTGIVPTTLGIEDPVLVELLQTLNELELRYASLVTTTGAHNPLTEPVESEIQKIRPNILDIVRNQQRRLQASRNNLNANSERFSEMISEIPEQERELLEISRRQTIISDLYAFLLQRKEEAELSAASTLADSRIVDLAEASVTPIASKRLLILAGALVAVFALAIAYVFFKEGLSNKILFRSAIERSTNIPVVGEIAHVNKAEASGVQSSRVLAAEFLQLQAALGLFTGGEPRQKILVASSFENEGKTLVSNQLAVSLASAGQKVLIVDFDLYTYRTSLLHQKQESKGFSDFIRGEASVEEVLHETGVRNLYVLPAGARATNTAELLLHPRMQDLFTLLESEFDFIVMDSAPTELTADAYLVANHCDLTLYVIRQGKSPNTLLQKFSNNPKLEAMPNLSIVFNDVSPRGFLTKYYGYGYGYGYESMVVSPRYLVNT